MSTQIKQKKIKGSRQKLKLFRSSEPLKSVLMWGVNYSHNALQHVRANAVFVRDDFKSSMKIKASNHYFDRDNMPSKYKFKEYSPLVFQSLRKKFNIDAYDYLDSFTHSEPEWDNTTVGRSGSKFLVTYNRNYVVKTINSDDLIQMQTILENYYAYIVQSSGNTLLPHYLGLYRVSVSDQETYLLVMRNVFSPRMPLHHKFDLKGSTVDREANEKEKNKPIPTWKDVDFLNKVATISIGTEAKELLLKKLENDIKFLQDNHLMDYSVLVGVHEWDSTKPFGADFLAQQETALASSPTASGPASAVNANASDPQEGDESDEARQMLARGTRFVSAGDGFGRVLELIKHQNRMTMEQTGPVSIGFPGLPTNGQGRGNDKKGFNYLSSRSQTTDEDEEMLSDPGLVERRRSSVARAGHLEQLTITAGSNMLTPPESPPNDAFQLPFSIRDMNRAMEFYGIPSAENQQPKCVYFIALIDILTRYGMRKKTAKTYKSVTLGHNADISTVKPEQYGDRLLDFMRNHLA